MKKYFKLLMVALFATLSFTLTSCGDDDDAGALIGKWEYNWTDPDDGCNYYGSVEFKKDDTFTMTEIDTEEGEVVYTNTVKGTYSVDGDVTEGASVYMVGVDSNNDRSEATVWAVVNGKTLYITDDEGEVIVFKKK